ncbi:MAG: PEP-utilizing enzyme [Acidimicrobiia bacterium]|nr:PEP-utilizing enzyme [Acidimicrobiia bacterium]MDH5236001.1 PEP-utilizing enzyme [Acidimicrobiia bacterium]
MSDVEAWPADNEPSRQWPLYTRGNVGEVFPDVVHPLNWLLYGPEAERGWRDAFEDLGLVTTGDLSPDEPWVILGVFGGYCYINASYVRMLGVRAPGSNVDAIDRQFFGESDAPPYVERPGDRDRRASARLAATIARTLAGRGISELAADMTAVDTLHRERPTGDVSSDRIWGFMVGYAPMFRQLFGRHIGVTFRAVIASGLLADICRDKLDDENLVVSMLAGIGSIESARPADALWQLSRLEGDAHATARDEVIGDFGYRGPNEWDIGSDTWGLRPELIDAAVDRLRGAQDSHAPATQRKEMQARRDRTVAHALTRLSRADRMLFKVALRAATRWSQAREQSKSNVVRSLHAARLAHRELAERTAANGGTAALADTCLLTPNEFQDYIEDPEPFLSIIDSRRTERDERDARVPPFVFEGSQAPLATWPLAGAGVEVVSAGDELAGIAGCPGVAEGRARVIRDPGDPGDLGPGDVLIAPITDPSWTPLFSVVEAVVVDVGAVMSHAVIVSRELGIPCVVSVQNATHRIPDGARVHVDGSNGLVRVLEEPV